MNQSTYEIPLVGGMRHGEIIKATRPFEFYEAVATPREPVVHYTADTPLPEIPATIPLVVEVYKLERFRKPLADGFIEKWRYVLDGDDERAARWKLKALKGIKW